jgi:tetratricopeptide (TPR) repeat protein
MNPSVLVRTNRLSTAQRKDIFVTETECRSNPTLLERTRASRSILNALLMVVLLFQPGRLFGQFFSVSDLCLLADDLRRDGRNEEALQIINAVLKLSPSRGEAYALRSGIRANLGQYEDGVVDGDSGVKLSKTPGGKALAAYNKGSNLTSLGRQIEALEAYRLALQFDPQFAVAYYERGKLFYLLGMWEEAKTELDGAIRVSPKMSAARSLRAEAQSKLGVGEAR